MSNWLTKSLIVGLLSVSAFGVIGQEFKATDTAEEPQVINDDAGTEAVYEAQKEPVQPPVQKADVTTPVTAAEQLNKFMEKKGWNPKYDDKKKRFFVVETAEFDCQSPAIDADFLVKREMKTKEAILRAKIQIIEFVNSKMSASDQITLPGHPLREKFDAKIKAAEKEFDLMKDRLEKFKEYMDKDEAAMIAGVTWSDRGKAFIDSLIKKIDEQYDSGKIADDKKEKYERSKQAYLKAKEEYDVIEQKAAALQGTLQSEMTSTVSKMAKMPLFGATVIAQAESWSEDDERYQVAVLVCWSKSLHRVARALATGENFKTVKTNRKDISIHDWLNKQNLTVMSGPRQFLDKDGNRWFLAVSARALPKASSQRRRAKSLAEMFASQMAVYSIYSDLASQKTASQMMQTRNAGERDDTQVAESMAEKLSASFQNKTVRGLQQLKSKTMIHPISGEDIYVCVYGINPSAAKSALAIERVNWATAVQSEKYQSLEKGRTDANTAAVNKAKNDAESYKRGRKDQTKAIDDTVAKREATQAQSQEKSKEQARKSKAKEEADRKSKSGVFIGDTDVDDDF